MTQVKLTTSNGTYLIDWGLIKRIVYSYYLYSAAYQRKKYKPISHDWWLPVTYEVEVPWNEVKKSAQNSTTNFLEIFKKRPEETYRLKELINEYEQKSLNFKHCLFEDMKRASNSSMKAIESNTDSWKLAIKTAELSRDSSAEFLLVGARFVPPPLGILAGSVGSAIKGTAVYQDTGNLGAATITATGSIITTLIPIGAADAGTKMPKGFIVLMEAAFDTAKNITQGDSLEEAISSAAINAAGDQILKKTVGLPPIKNLLRKSAIPVALKLTPATPIATAHAVEKFYASNIKSRIKQSVKKINISTPTPIGMCLVNSTPVLHKSLTETAIIKLH